MQICVTLFGRVGGLRRRSRTAEKKLHFVDDIRLQRPSVPFPDTRIDRAAGGYFYGIHILGMIVDEESGLSYGL